MSEEILKNITIKQFEKEDLCLEDFSEERLYDYCTLEEFYEDIINTLRGSFVLLHFLP